jgi:hypothetical protein
VNNADNTDQVEIYVLDSFALLAHLEDEEEEIRIEWI